MRIFLTSFFCMCLFTIMYVSPANAEIISQYKKSYYDVTGNKLNKVRTSINKNRSGDQDISTKWDIKWNYDFERTRDGDCEIAALNVSLNLTSELPLWSGYEQAGASDKSLWDEYINLLSEHEKSQRINAELAAQKIFDTLYKHKNICSKMSRSLDSMAKSIIDDYKDTEQENNIKLKGYDLKKKFF